MLEYYTALMVFMFGAIIGSFLNVVGLRLLRDENFVWADSRCYHCDTILQPRDNIPIISWMMLKGKCRYCSNPISLQYPAVEILTGLLFAGLYLKFHFSWQAFLLAIMFCNFVVILVTDFKEQFIYDFNSLGLIPFGLAFSFFNLGHYAQGNINVAMSPTNHIIIPMSFVMAVLAVVGSFLLFFGLNLFSKIVIGKQGFGEGDSRLLMGIGSFVGIGNMFLVFALSFIIQTAIGIPVLLWAWYKQKAYKTLAYLIGGFALAVTPYLLQTWIKQPMMLLGVSLLIGAVAMVLAYKAIQDAKNLPSGLTYLPFGPAIVLAAIAFVFFQAPIIHVFKML